MHGAMLEDFLVQEFPHVRRAALRQLMAGEGVHINGMPEARNVRLRGFDLVEVCLPEDGFASKVASFTADLPAVLTETASFLVIDKQAGLLSVPNRQGTAQSVHAMLPALRSDADLRIVHRLDRETSGCLVLGKGLLAAQHFDRMLRDGRVHKEYLALVHGSLPRESRTIELPLMPDPRRAGKTVVARGDERTASDARTDLVVAAVHGDFSLLLLRPRTGRTHQLRCHLAAIGHPIIADELYGGRPLLLSELKRGYKLRRGVRERALLERTFLHAARIGFPDLDGTDITVESPLPDDLQTALTRLERAEPVRT